MFAYCGNNPVVNYDPDGVFFLSMLVICVMGGGLIGGIAGGFAGNYYADIQGYSGYKRAACIVIGTLGGGAIGGTIGYYSAPVLANITGIAGVSLTSKGGIVLIPLQLLGQNHHVLSNPIMRALANHPLGGLFERAESVVQALTKDAHRGYQQWHRTIDNHMVNWLIQHPNASPNEFWKEMYRMYNNKDLIQRFGEGVLNYIKQQLNK